MSELIDAEPPVLVHQQAHFQWWQRCIGGALEIALVGDLDLATAGALDRLLDGLAGSAAAAIRLDLSRLDFIDGHSAGLIERTAVAVRARGGVLSVEGVRGLPARVFAILGVRTRP